MADQDQKEYSKATGSIIKSNKTIEIEEYKSNENLLMQIAENKLNTDKHSINQFKPITNGTSKILKPKLSP